MISLFLLGSGANLRSGILLWLFKEQEKKDAIELQNNRTGDKIILTRFL